MGDEFLLNFGVKIQRQFIIYRIAMTTFGTSQCQDSDEVLEFYELRCEGIKRSFRKPKHTTEHIMKDSKRYFVETFGKFWT